jgi:hypothetical protein
MKKTLLLLALALVFSPNMAFSGGHHGRHHGNHGYGFGYQQPYGYNGAQINQYVYNNKRCDDDYGRPQVYNNYYAPPVRQYYAPQPVVVTRNHYYGQPAFQPNLVPIYPRNSINVQFGF